MSDWSDRALAKVRERSKDKQTRDLVWLEEQKLKKAHGTLLWQEIRDVVKKHVSDFNEKVQTELLFFEAMEDNALRLRSEIEDHRRFLQAFFDEDTGNLTYECGTKKRGWRLSIVEGKVDFYRDDIPTTPDSIAEQMLDALIGGTGQTSRT